MSDFWRNSGKITFDLNHSLNPSIYFAHLFTIAKPHFQMAKYSSPFVNLSKIHIVKE